MNHTLSDSQLEAMIKSAVNSSGPLPPDEKFSQLISALRELQERRKADSEPVAEVVSIYGDPEAFGEREIRPLVGIQQMPYGTKLYRHAQQPVVPEEATSDSIEILASARRRDHAVFQWGEDQRNADADSWNACRATMLQAFPVCTCPSGDGSLRWPCPVHPGNSPVIPDGYVMVPKEPTQAMCAAFNDSDYGRKSLRERYVAMLAAAPQEPKS
ncbi:TPA: rRNA adenine N-6-methyltransferase family protein [Klebsiella variicola subsp. variicola]|uniref:rRNA adenine N-6-methyltransferase family protein n=1 Tax=Klebsiella pneumoniae TaxID=573 RepID=UPI001CBCE1EB|nr:rRNA adenine N-6-methyltransferase family protein [Klebsiella pneumoniae]MDP1036430.1 rRNA adenine N-6-methyltransferase family protein [Klebsiella pneumoniae]